VATFEDYFLGATGEKVCNPQQSIRRPLIRANRYMPYFWTSQRPSIKFPTDVFS
jgi:hypothetical protein